MTLADVAYDIVDFINLVSPLVEEEVMSDLNIKRLHGPHYESMRAIQIL